jgi:hypothetical protein
MSKGAPLLIEDLDVTMKCVIYTIPTLCTQKYIDRVMRQLRERNIAYTVSYIPRPPEHYFFFLTDLTLKVGDREYLFSIN